MSVNCKYYKKYKSIRSGSFFDNSNISIKMVLQIILFYVARMPRSGMINYLNLVRSTILRIINKIVDRIPDPDFSSNKFGGDGKIVQVDETMLNYKIKSYRGKASTNRTDALCIIEFENEIKRVFACIIP
ncbi:hypothetical protein DMUE_5224, partial [Dictyocoela muelleri]